MKPVKKLLSAILVLGIAVILTGSAFAGKAFYRINNQLSVGPWAEKSGIQIAPVYLASPDYSLNFLSLDQATKQGLIEVTETGTVNELLVENNSKKPILLLAGEVVRGGKQDRMVGKDMILGPGKTRKIAVFCIEHGRWVSYEGKQDFKSSSLMADKLVRQKAQTRGGSSGNQSRVWDEVAKSLSEYDVSAPTGNYQEILKSDKFRDGDAIAKFFLARFANDDQIAGFVLAYNREVQSLEYFASPALAGKYKEKLIRSYVTSALKNIQDSSPIEIASIKNFANQILSEETHQYKTDDEVLIESRSDQLESFELLTPRLKTVHYARYLGTAAGDSTRGD